MQIPSHLAMMTLTRSAIPCPHQNRNDSTKDVATQTPIVQEDNKSLAPQVEVIMVI
jgi:hypothetical protein